MSAWGVRAYRVFSRPLHSALKRQLKAEKKVREREAKVGGARRVKHYWGAGIAAVVVHVLDCI